MHIIIISVDNNDNDDDDDDDDDDVWIRFKENKSYKRCIRADERCRNADQFG